MEKIPRQIMFDATTVANRMKLLEETKPLAWQTYMVRLAMKDPQLMIDFTKPVPESALVVLNSIFDIDSVIFFTVDDEEIENNPEIFLRPEE